MTDQELKNLVAKLAIKSDRIDAQIAQLVKAQARTDAQLAITATQLAKTDAQLAKTDAQLAKTDAQLAKTDTQLAKTDAQLARTDARLEKVAKKLDAVAEMLGGVANSNGEITEEFFFNSLSHTPQIGDLHFQEVKAKVILKDAGQIKAELDILMLNGQAAAVIEVKHRPNKDDVAQVLKAVAQYKDSLPAGKKYKIYGGIAGFSVSRGVINAAKENGLFVLKQAGLVITSQTQAMKAF
ncbi:MAG: hypothetical protein RLZZ502_473 [Pseudomonadota bacterium]|jgi:multidrug efflux pump subunit AcrA (membrane-fusion protein)